MAARRAPLALGVASLLLVAYASVHGTGAIGPDKWGSLCPDYELCSKGKHQSPINIVNDDVVYDPKLEPLQRDYAATNATLVDNGFNIAVREMTAEQLAELKAPLHEEYYNNSRPTQPLNGRTVLLYDESNAD
ncbi:hypothetical protein BHE74_00001263 [Ensete ventricosum]|nr:hypothetical protein BHE74_00001263 [Ensete ventricosum]RZR87304.1 hypothetical protein BHM03_00014668 [Ensete ventricosum]